MPRKEIDYSKTIIYKLCCRNPEITDVYVGHTTDFTKRKCQHKSHCHNEKTKMYNYDVYKFIRDNGGFENWNMVMIEEYPCENKLQAERKEREYIENLNATLNRHIPTRTHEEYREQYKEQLREKSKKYREENAEEIKERKKKYYNENIEKIKEYRSQQIQCECGLTCTPYHQARHKRTNKHLELMKLKETET